MLKLVTGLCLGVLSVASLFHCHTIFALCLLVLRLCAGDALFAQVFVAAHMRVGKSSTLFDEDGDAHQHHANRNY